MTQRNAFARNKRTTTAAKACRAVVTALLLAPLFAGAQPAPAAQPDAATPRQAGETTAGRPPSPALPAPSTIPAAEVPPTAPLPGDAAKQAPATSAQQPATPAPAPQVALPGPASTPAAGSLLQTILALALVLAVLGGLAWFLKRFGPRMAGSGTNLKLVGALNIGGRERIMVVEVGDQWIVVGASPGRINALATLPRQEGAAFDAVPATHASPAANFSDWLKNTIDKRNAK
ncbi:flagellar biosynthetic protein FliO [Massilia niastensis]|uniref:flagellar biosynthetic protein FliO n=1 Tax=Massilia niastensis TaxID=544911 RepID=UPI00036F3FF5|nr:flagellar biosynthetic protein FliO [Massilia niastensis]